MPPWFLKTAFNGNAATFLNGNGAFTSPGASSFVMTNVEVDLGTTAKRGGRFTISGTFTVDKPVEISQANGAYTNKGTRADEAEMDKLVCSGKTITEALIEVFWRSQTKVKGNFKFNYVVSA